MNEIYLWCYTQVYILCPVQIQEWFIFKVFQISVVSESTAVCMEYFTSPGIDVGWKETTMVLGSRPIGPDKFGRKESEILNLVEPVTFQ